MANSKYIHWTIILTLFISGMAGSLYAQDKKLTKLLEKGNLEKAETHCFMQKGDKRSHCYSALADYWLINGNWKKADENWFKAYVMYPPGGNVKDGNLKLADKYYFNSKWDKAIWFYERAHDGEDQEKLKEIEQYVSAKSKLEEEKELLKQEKASKIPPKLVFEDYASKLDFAVFSPNGRYILSGGRIDEKIGDYPIHLWDIETGKMIRSYGEVKKHGDEWIQRAEFTPDGKHILLGGRELKLVNFETGKYVWTKQLNVVEFAMSGDGEFIVVANTGNESVFIGRKIESFVTLMETKSGNTIKTFDLQGEDINSVAVSRKGKLVAATHRGDSERAVRLWDVNTGMEYRKFRGHLREVTCVAFSPDDKYVLSGSLDNTLKLWDIETGQEVRTFRGAEAHPPNKADFSTDGKQIVVGYFGRTIVFEVETGQILKSAGNGGKYSSFSNDGKIRLDVNEKSIKLFEAKTNNEIAALVSFNNYNDWLVTSNDGRFDGSKGAMEQIYYEVDNDFLPLESFYEHYYTPNLFSRKIDGDKFLERGSINNLKLPPTLIMNANISGGLLSHQKRIDVSITPTDQGGGIDEIRLYQNAKLIKSKKIVGEDKNMIASVTLISEYGGENYFKAVAFSKGRTESKPAKLTVTYAGSKDARPHLYLLAIGINDYKNPKYKLNYAQADAKAFVEELNKSGANLFVEKHLTFIENDKATKATILKAFEEIQGQILEQDVFIFYYAGHGILSDAVMEDKDYYLIMHDVVNMFGDSETLVNKAISTTELKELSQNLNAQKQIFFMDACQSGGAVELLAHRGIVDEKAIAQLARSTGTFWLAASGSEQFATEFKTLGHGVFTYSILQGLTGQADVGKDGIVTVKELSMFLEKEVPDLSAKFKGKQQYPISYGFGQDFPLIINNN